MRSAAIAVSDDSEEIDSTQHSCRFVVQRSSREYPVESCIDTMEPSETSRLANQSRMLSDVLSNSVRTHAKTLLQRDTLIYLGRHRCVETNESQSAERLSYVGDIAPRLAFRQAHNTGNNARSLMDRFSYVISSLMTFAGSTPVRR